MEGVIAGLFGVFQQLTSTLDALICDRHSLVGLGCLDEVSIKNIFFNITASPRT